LKSIDVAKIYESVAAMFRVNMGLQPGEKVLVVTDLPRPHDWQKRGTHWLATTSSRNVLARAVVDIAHQAFPDAVTDFLAFPATGSHGAEPPQAVAERIAAANVVIALTAYSLSHTDARLDATRAGARVASMPEFDTHMFYSEGPMAVDYQQVAADCLRFAQRLTQADRVQVRTPNGTDLSFRLGDRPGQVDTGLYDQPGTWGNLPAGEAYAIPLEGTGEGKLVAPAGWYPHLEQDMILRFEKGRVVEILGGGDVGDNFRRILDLSSEDLPFAARRNLAELGIGANPRARTPDNVLEAEKIKGTVHIAIGDNLHMGGQVESDLHEDFVLPSPDLILDDDHVIISGEWQI
jgi:aminopeptidase